VPPIVKRWLRHAEANGDDEIMAALMVAFDRLVRFGRTTRRHYDWETREVFEATILYLPRNAMPLSEYRTWRDWQGRDVRYPIRTPPGARLFSYHTRRYLRRRAWRYFRRLGYQRPDEYVAAVARALVRYTDADLARGEDLLESWGLVQVCFRHHPALEVRTSDIRVQAGHTLAELLPAPWFLKFWQRPASASILLRIAAQAAARLVRVWALGMLRGHHLGNLQELPVDQLFPLLEHTDDDIQQFAAEMLRQSPHTASLPLETWRRLLQTRDTVALSAICSAFRRHVAREQLGVAGCVELACQAATPVARMGFELLCSVPRFERADCEALAALSQVRNTALAAQIAQWALAMIGQGDRYSAEQVSRFFDSPLRPTRDAAWQWLTTESPGYRDPVLWARLLETPYDDVRLRLIDELQRRAAMPVVSEDLDQVWAAVLLGVHRGGRQKLKAIEQLGRAIDQDPRRAEKLLPVLVAAVRSIRAPERRAGLATLLELCCKQPAVLEQLGRALPELLVAAEEFQR
jgi:hypothetical protein